MILQVPFAYKAFLVCGRRRNPDEVTLLGSAPCEVRETTAERAPVVMWWGDAGALQDCIRHHEGRLYAPVLQPEHDGFRGRPLAFRTPAHAGTARRWAPLREEDAVDPDGCEDDEDEDLGRSLDAAPDGSPPDLGYGRRHLVDAAGFAEALAEGVAWVDDRQVGKEKSPPKPTHEITPDGMVRRIGDPGPGEPLRRVKSSAEEAERSGFGRMAGALLSVDGVLFQEVSRPVYVLRSYSSARPEMHRSFLKDADRGSRYEHVFLAERHEEFVELHRELWSKGNPGREYDAYGYGSLPAPEILRPDLLPEADQNDIQVRAVAAGVIQDLSRYENGYRSGFSGGPRVSGYPRDVIISFGRLRDALGSEASLADIVDAMGRLAQACEPHGTLHDIRDSVRIACGRAEAAFTEDLAMGCL
jgi:hypothetical protein